MSSFQIAVNLTLKHEGGFTDNPADPGGATNMGITQRDMPGIFIRDLTINQAEAFYQSKFWNPLYSGIIDQNIANKLFDMGVLFGVGTAVQILQETLRSTYNIGVDGNFGPETLAALNHFEPVMLLAEYKQAMVNRAIAIGAARPAEQIFVSGWINRINS